MDTRSAPGRVEVPPDPRDLEGEFPFRRTMEVRFGDTDAMGHVNNAVYLTYCESARVSYFEAATGRSFLSAGGGAPAPGGPPAGATAAGAAAGAASGAASDGHVHAHSGAGTEGGVGAAHRWSFILAEARVTYRSPAYFGETLTIEARTCRIGRSSMTTQFRITAPESAFGPARLIAVSESVEVTFDYVAGRPVELPADLVELIEAFEGRKLRDA